MDSSQIGSRHGSWQVTGANDRSVDTIPFQAIALLEAHREGLRKTATSLDLGLSEVEVVMERDRVALGPGIDLPMPALEEMGRNRDACFLVQNGRVKKVQTFSV